MPVLVKSAPNAHLGYAFAGGLLGLVAGASVGLVAWRVKEPATEAPVDRQTDSLIAAMKSTMHTRPFVILSVALALVRLGLTLLQTSLAFFVIYRLQLGKEGLPMLMGVLLITVAVTIPFWKWLCTVWTKNGAYAVGVLICATGLVLTYWMEPGHKMAMMGIMVLMGMGMGAHWVAPYAMLPDVVDFAESHTGERRTGVYYGVYGLMDKLSRTFGSVAVGWWLDWFGYIPNAVQTAHADQGIRLITGPIPAAVLLMALPLLIAYPLNRAAHQRIKMHLQMRRVAPTTLMTRF
jgi:GPH family glycoside/pentoside/hexuronide:cation symporter